MSESAEGKSRDRKAAERAAKGRLESDARGKKCSVGHISYSVVQKGNGKNRDWKIKASAKLTPKDDGKGKRKGSWF